MAGNGTRFRLGILIVFLMAPVPAAAQILNTLRGWDNEDIGWSGGVEGALALADGNTRFFEHEIAGAIQFQNDRNRWRLLGRSMRRTAYDTELARSNVAHLRHNYRLSTRFASIAFAQAQYEPFNRIDERLLLGAGARFDLARNTLWRAALGGAIMFESETLTSPDELPSEAARFSFFLTVFRDVAKGVDLDLVGFYQPRVDQPSDARASFVGSVRIDIWSQLYLFSRYILQWDSEPAAGVLSLDQNMRAGLGYRF